ncbi:MAG: M28 family peptidase [Bacteroidota bacterium]|nr:M28 family peptidase [Candidatus Kapabacteria bacterium]MCS7302275.1 M28 family peptidase [Candidatus Kapabacteria bacterium]MDW8074435.1 M28 family peptidase [Bacteroidota bacterium]
MTKKWHALFWLIALVSTCLHGEGCSGSCSSARSPQSADTSLSPIHAPVIPAPDPERLVQLVRAQLQWGPRVPNTAAHDSCRVWLLAQLRGIADTVFEQPFRANVYGRTYQCTNIIARLFPEQPQRILLCAHWDSRPYADEDPVTEHRTRPVPGANDGASGVAVILELVSLLRQSPPPAVGIDVVLFDAEDMGAPSDEKMFCLGSKHFATYMPLSPRPRYGILFDMVGDRDARFPMEYNSYQAAASVVERLWRLGKLYGGGHFIDQIGGSVVDDHLPLIEAGIPTVNIIDLELVGNSSPSARRRYWHTTKDTLDNISGNTLASVARVVLALLYSDTPFPL